ncbi:MAG: alkaline phosphatase D family protein [Pseudomonadota bacterium]
MNPANPHHAAPALQATTPSLGVRLWVDAGQVCLQVANEGGRGAPLLMLVLPVQRGADGRLAALQPLPALAADATAWAGFLRLQARRLPATLPMPATERFSGADWQRLSQGQPQVLVLVLFHRNDGGATAAGQRAAPVLDLQQHAAAIAQAVLAFFDAPPTPGWLRRGLVQLAAADVPGADPGPDAFTLALASCHYPAGLMDGTPADWSATSGRLPGPADAAMLRLAQRLDTLAEPARPSLLLLTGDQIYADATAGLFDPRSARLPARGSGAPAADDWLRKPYQHWLASVGTQAVLGLLPSRMLMDDHEIADNWAPLPAGADAQARLQARRRRAAGREAFLRHQRNLPAGVLPGVLWQTVRHRGIGFFLADTRTERSARTASGDALRPRILARRQAHALQRWLALDVQQPAFVVSPSMLLPRRRASARSLAGALQSDAWCGFPGSLHGLLAQLWRLGRQNLVFLSGDEHLSCAVEATISDAARSRSVRILSIHSSGLYAPYPFANSVPEDFMLPDAWQFADPADPQQQFHCTVQPCGPWVPGDGFALISLVPPAAAGAAWQLQLQFDRADAAGPVQVFPLPSG